jgi:hypothetical protein
MLALATVILRADRLADPVLATAVRVAIIAGL